MRTSITAAAVGGLVLVGSMISIPAAFADHGSKGEKSEQELSGACSISSSYEAKLESKRGTQRLKVEVKTAQVGEQWQLDLSADDVTFEPVVRTAYADDDDSNAEVEWKNTFSTPVGTIEATATNAVTGETCAVSFGTATTPVVTDPVVPNPVVTDPTDPGTTPATTTGQTAAKAKFTRTQVSQHAAATDCWTIIGKNVYDLTSYVNQHPGGPSRIIGICGANGSSAFKGQHMSDRGVAQVLASFKVGKLKK